jgi:hypothetical protein
MTVRVAIDTLANVLAEGLGLESDGVALTDRYMSSLSRIQGWLESRESGRRRRRQHSELFKAEAVGACQAQRPDIRPTYE